MISTIEYYLDKGWKVDINNNDQVVLSAPKGTGFFPLNNPSQRERIFIENYKKKKK